MKQTFTKRTWYDLTGNEQSFLWEVASTARFQKAYDHIPSLGIYEALVPSEMDERAWQAAERSLKEKALIADSLGGFSLCSAGDYVVRQCPNWKR